MGGWIHDFYFDTILNYHLYQKLKLIEKCEFYYSINILTSSLMALILQIGIIYSVQNSFSN